MRHCLMGSGVKIKKIKLAMKDSTCFHRMLYAHVLFFFSHNDAILCRFSTTSYRCIRHIRKAGKGKKKNVTSVETKWRGSKVYTSR